MKINLPRHDIKWSKPPAPKHRKTGTKRRHCGEQHNTFFVVPNVVIKMNADTERPALPERSDNIIDTEMEEITNESQE